MQKQICASCNCDNVSFRSVVLYLLACFIIRFQLHRRCISDNCHVARRRLVGWAPTGSERGAVQVSWRLHGAVLRGVWLRLPSWPCTRRTTRALRHVHLSWPLRHLWRRHRSVTDQLTIALLSIQCLTSLNVVHMLYSSSFSTMLARKRNKHPTENSKHLN